MSVTTCMQCVGDELHDRRASCNRRRTSRRRTSTRLQPFQAVIDSSSSPILFFFQVPRNEPPPTPTPPSPPSPPPPKPKPPPPRRPRRPPTALAYAASSSSPHPPTPRLQPSRPVQQKSFLQITDSSYPTKNTSHHHSEVDDHDKDWSVRQTTTTTRPSARSLIRAQTKASFVSPTPSSEADDEDSVLGHDNNMESDGDDDRDEGTCGPPQYHGDDTRFTSKKELTGWYSYGWAAEVFAICAMGEFSCSLRQHLELSQRITSP